jgi:isocitrate dehydrogenase
MPLALPVLSVDPDYEPTERNVVGLDVFVESPLTASELGASLTELAEGTRLELKMISSRGTGVPTDGRDHRHPRSFGAAG